MVRGGVAVELVHLGSLYHDDVMDEAETRRGIEAVNHRWGNLTAILAGDFLLAKASELAASLGTEVAELLAATIGRLCEGQVRELQLIYDVTRNEEQYLQAISGKTAELYATSCRIGGIVGGAERDVINRLTEFGHAYGMAFQVVDDILDLVATDEELGKPSGNDIREGVYTLPVIRMIESGHPVKDLLGGPLDEETPRPSSGCDSKWARNSILYRNRSKFRESSVINGGRPPRDPRCAGHARRCHQLVVSLEPLT